MRYAYDPHFPRLIERIDGAGTTQFAYYPSTSTPLIGAGQLRSVDGPLPNDTIIYTYDELGRVVGRSIGGVAQSSRL